ncbi:MAG TPA: hypothetical protein VIV60_30140, partial [Polyangiaceae bacterium]
MIDSDWPDNPFHAATMIAGLRNGTGLGSFPFFKTEIKTVVVQNIVVAGKSGAGKQPRIDVLVERFGLTQ